MSKTLKDKTRIVSHINILSFIVLSGKIQENRHEMASKDVSFREGVFQTSCSPDLGPTEQSWGYSCKIIKK
jgi:transposase